jgi:hypothetical protein
MSTLNTYNLKSPDSANTNLALDASGNVAIQAGSASAPSIYVTGDTNTGLYSPGADQVAVTTGGTARLFVDASGRLLVGTSSTRTVSFWDTPQVQIEGLDYQKSSLSIYNNQNEIYGAVLSLGHSRGTSVGSNTVLQNNDYTGVIAFYGSDGSNESRAAEIAAYVDGTPGTNDMPGRLVFSTTADGASSPTERMRIDANGHVTIYKDASNLARLHLNGSSTRLEYSDSSGDLTFYTNTSGRVQVGYTGGFRPVTDNSQALGTSGQRWTAVFAVNGTIQTSDLREKTDIATSSLGTDFIKQLRPVSYKFKVGENIVTKDEDGETDIVTPRPGERTHWGFIAQEVKEVADAAGVDFGGWILTDRDDPASTQGLRYDQFIAPLTKALQEALEKIETLEAKVAALESA